MHCSIDFTSFLFSGPGANYEPFPQAHLAASDTGQMSVQYRYPKPKSISNIVNEITRSSVPLPPRYTRNTFGMPHRQARHRLAVHASTVINWRLRV